MIPFGAETVTLYNRRETKDANGRTVITWYRTVLTGCSWAHRRARVWDGTAVILADEVTCRIPEDARYRSPDGWGALTSVTGAFTLAPGDILVRGAVADEIGSTRKPSELIERHKRAGVMTVNVATNNVRPGLPLGHYLARGV